MQTWQGSNVEVYETHTAYQVLCAAGWIQSYHAVYTILMMPFLVTWYFAHTLVYSGSWSDFDPAHSGSRWRWRGPWPWFRGRCQRREGDRDGTFGPARQPRLRGVSAAGRERWQRHQQGGGKFIIFLVLSLSHNKIFTIGFFCVYLVRISCCGVKIKCWPEVGLSDCLFRAYDMIFLCVLRSLCLCVKWGLWPEVRYQRFLFWAYYTIGIAVYSKHVFVWKESDGRRKRYQLFVFEPTLRCVMWMCEGERWPEERLSAFLCLSQLYDI